MTFVAPALSIAALRPYVETHSIGGLWLAVAVAAGVIEVIGAGRQRAEATKKDGGSRAVLRLFVTPGVVLLIFSPRIAPGATIHPPLASVIVGIVLFAGGEAMRIWAKVALGRYFTYTVMTSSDQPVITSGPYRFVRHPSYTGMMLMAAGAGFAYGNWLGLGAITLLMLCAVIYRIRVEEQALLDELGDRYRSYAAHHKRLVPFVW